MERKHETDLTEGTTSQDCMMYKQDRMMYQRKNEIYDVTFYVGKCRTAIRANKIVLASRSPVFRMMFLMKEGSMNEGLEIDVPDIDEITFNEILRYLYTDDVKISTENVKRMVYAAELYSLSTLKTTCDEFLMSTTKSADSVVSLSTANEFHLKNLRKESLQYIEENTGECLLSAHAVKVDGACIKLILESENLSCSETDVCKFFLKWAETQCQMRGQNMDAMYLRAIAGELISLIKFLLVEKTYFSKTVSKSLLLTSDESESVFRYHCGEECLLFSAIPRCSRKTLYTHRYTSFFPIINSSTDINIVPSKNDVLHVQKNKPIWLKGCLIFKPTVEITQSSSKCVFKLFDEFAKLLSSEILDILSGIESNVYVAIELLKPILLTANRQYTILVCDITPYTNHGCDSNNSSSACYQDGLKITFENPQTENFPSRQIAGIMSSILCC